MKKIYYALCVCLGMFIASAMFLLKTSPDNDFKTTDFQNHVFNTNVLFVVTEDKDEPGYFSGTVFKYLNTYYILTCGHGIEDLPNLDNVNVYSLLFNDQGELIDKLQIPVKLINASYSEDSHTKGVDIAIFEVMDSSNVLGYANLKSINLKPMDKVICVGNSYGIFLGGVYQGTVVKQQICLNDKWPEKFFLTTCEIRSGCSGGGVFTKVNGKYYYCGMILRSDLKGEGMFRSLDSMNKWLLRNDLNFIPGS